MKTVAEIGRVMLSHFFKKKEIFRKTRYEELGMVKLKKEVVCPKDKFVDLQREFLTCVTNVYGRQNHYILYLWGIETGLIEIQITDANEGKLIAILNDIEENEKRFCPSHLVVAKNRTNTYFDGEEEYTEREEEITIYSLLEEQKKEIMKSFQV